MSNKVDLTDIPELIYNPANSQHRAAAATALTCMLERAGFSYSDSESKREEVWVRCLNGDPNIRVKVYTSITSQKMMVGRHMTTFRFVRQNGDDAIRVCATKIVNGQEVGLVKRHSTNRTGTLRGIAQRTLDKMREVYKLANQRRSWNPQDQRCQKN